MVFLENKQFIGLNYILWDKRGNCESAPIRARRDVPPSLTVC